VLTCLPDECSGSPSVFDNEQKKGEVTLLPNNR
jgi:hypothetical protein